MTACCAIAAASIGTILASEFIRWALDFHNSFHLRTQHLISNVICEIDGDTANCETYWHYACFNKQPPPPVALAGGRYFDRFERRDGRWAIAARQCVIDWHGTPGDMLGPPGGVEVFNRGFPPTRDRSDPSFKKPYAVEPSRIGYRYEY